MGAFVLAVNLEIKPDDVDRFMAMALENAKATRETEPGCRQFDVLVDPADRKKVMFYEVYDNEAAFQAHQQTAHFKKYFETALGYLAQRGRTFYTRVAP
jgi:(4S)-4-hydroxy-5-phosphonooxypentane-2,3-dione isomerase